MLTFCRYITRALILAMCPMVRNLSEGLVPRWGPWIPWQFLGAEFKDVVDVVTFFDFFFAHVLAWVFCGWPMGQCQ